MFRNVIIAVSAVVCLLLVAPDAAARSVLIDPDGLTWWEQIVAWLSPTQDAIGTSVDPNG